MASDLVKQGIIDDMPRYVQELCATDKCFSTSKGGTFRCPICGGKLKLYRRTGGAKYPWGISAYTCDHFGRTGQYSNDSFGIYAAAHGLDQKEAFMELMKAEGGFDPLDPEIRRKREQAAVERAERDRAWEATKARAKAYNLGLIETRTGWGYAMSDTGKALLRQRGLEVSALPKAYADLVGYLPKTSFKKQDETGTYPIEGVVFKLGAGSYQIRKTHGSTYVSKDEKTSRFMTLGPAELFGWEAKDDTKADPLFITEGPFDAISLVAAGARRVVSLQGCETHGALLEKLLRDHPKCGGVLLTLDADKAGQEAVTKLYSELQRIPQLTPIKAPVFHMEEAGIHDPSDWLQQAPAGLAVMVSVLRMEGWLFPRGWEEDWHYKCILDHLAEDKDKDKKRSGAECISDLRSQYSYFKGGQ